MTTPTLRDDEIRALRVACAKAKGALDRFVVLAFNTDGERPRLSIPANPERDDDLALGDALNGFARLLDSHDALARKVERLRAVVATARDALRLLQEPRITSAGGSGGEWSLIDRDPPFVREAAIGRLADALAALAALPAHDSTKEE